MSPICCARSREKMLTATALAAALVQAAAMSWDELVLHRRRRLGAVESWGHVADSLSYLIALAIAALAPVAPPWKAAYVCAAVFSCALITKDEWIHAEECEPSEHWIHAVLFVTHPCVLILVGILWIRGEAGVLRLILPGAVALFCAYQAVYWIAMGRRRRAEPTRVNNEFYGTLGERWHSGDDHAIALLRAETRERLAYVREVLRRADVTSGARIIDIGCGGGLVSNALAADGYRVKGVDAAAGALDVARAHIPTGSDVVYEVADAYALAETAGAYDVVLLLDVLEHFEEPARAVAQAARVLRPGGLLIVHTFNRTWRSWLLAVKGVALVARDCPPNLHVYRLLLKPRELDAMCVDSGLKRTDAVGIRPKILSAPFWSSLLRRRVHPDFAFVRSPSLAVGYLACYAKLPSC